MVILKHIVILMMVMMMMMSGDDLVYGRYRFLQCTTYNVLVVTSFGSSNPDDTKNEEMADDV